MHFRFSFIKIKQDPLWLKKRYYFVIFLDLDWAYGTPFCKFLIRNKKLLELILFKKKLIL